MCSTNGQNLRIEQTTHEGFKEQTEVVTNKNVGITLHN